MKNIRLILAAAAVVLLAACTKESEVGKWYGYNREGDKSDVAYVLDLKADGSADFIISAWGDRYQGRYTYDGKVVTLNWNKYLGRLAAIPSEEAGHDRPCAPENLYKWWEEYTATSETYQDKAAEGNVLRIEFTFKGDKGTINMFNKPCTAERQ